MLIILKRPKLIRVTTLRRFVLSLFIAGCFPTHFIAQAQTDSPVFRHFTTEDGLPSSETYFVLGDSKGYMWFATDHGVARYNGYEFKTFTTKDGLPDNTVFKLFEDRKGRIWMLTFSGKIFYFEKNKIFPYQFNSLVNKENENIIPMGLYVDEHENVYVTFLSKGELKIDNKGNAAWKFINTGIYPLRYVIDEFDSGTLLISACYNENYNKIHPVMVIHAKDLKTDTVSFAPLPTGKFSAIRMSKDKLIYALSGALFEISGGTVKFLCYAPAEVSFLMKDNNNRLWVGTSNGVYCYDNGNFASPGDHYLGEKSISGILRDHEGGYWFTTLEDGIFYLAGDAVHSIYFKEEYLQKPLCLTIVNNDAVYAGYLDGAIVEIKNGHGKPVFVPEQKKVINSLYADPGSEKIYISQGEPGFLEGKIFRPLKHKVIHGLKTNFLKHSDGSIYCSGSSFIFKIKNDSLVDYTNVSQRINCLAESEDHHLLLGCNSGVYRYDESENKIEAYHSGLSNLRVDDIQWFGNTLCFATRGKGVLFLKNGRLTQIDESKGLCSDLITKLFVNDNDVWCATNNGISHIRFHDKDTGYTISTIHVGDGLLSDEINDITQLNDTIYVATKSGISYFQKNLDFINHTNPFIQVTKLRVNNSDTDVTSGMEFNHNSNNIRIGFDGISYRSKGKISYRYMLASGQDTLSEFTMNRDVEFLSLAPGHYTFSVSAKNNSQVWSSSPATFSFFIRPAWWQTWWFKLLVAVAVAALIYVVYKMQLKKMREKFDAERSHASLHLTALRAQMNPHFIFNMMSSIRSYMQRNDSASAEKYLTSFAKHLRNTLDNSEIQEISLDEELKALKTYADLEMQGTEKGFEFSIQCDPGIDMEDTMLPSLLLQPFVENSVKHGISRLNHCGKISIEIKKINDSILISVEDNGIGRQEASRQNGASGIKHTSHGTALTFDRISAFNKAYNRNISATVIDLTDTEGKSTGTRVEIKI